MKKNPLRIQSYFLLGFLGLQYLLGMAANLFVKFPDTNNEKTLWEFAKTQSLLVTHIVLAFLLLIGGIVFLVRAMRRKEKNWIIAASVGLVSILVAIIGGAQFVPTQQDGYSYTMAIAFMVALLSYGWGLYSDSAKK
jgi:uncharacterized membrane protein HdeD (DUF308 family)